MKRARERNSTISSRRCTRKFQRALHCFRARVAKENGIQMWRHPFHNRFCQQSAQKRAIHLHHVWQIEIKHIADRLFHYRMIPSDIENAVAAKEIEVRLVIHVVEVRALCPRIDFVEPDHALRGHERAVHMPFMQLIILTQARGDNFL